MAQGIARCCEDRARQRRGLLNRVCHNKDRVMPRLAVSGASVDNSALHHKIRLIGKVRFESRI